VEDLTIRGTWGTSFRAPSFPENSPLASNSVFGYNKAGGESSDTIPVVCSGGLPVAGSAAARVNPTCDPALMFPGGIAARGSAGTSSFMRTGSVRPEKATNYGLGIQYVPTNFLRGLNAEVTYYKLHISDILQQVEVDAANFNDPAYSFLYITPDQVGAATYADYIAGFYKNPATLVPPSAASNLLWIADSATRNLGYLIQDGIDYNVRYDWDMSESGLGLWEAGITGTYTFKSETSLGLPGSVPIDAFHTTLGSGAVTAYGVSSRPRYVYRARLGWSDMGWTVTGFFNYSAHHYHNQAAPPAAYLAKFPNYRNLSPEFHTFDLSVAYNTENRPANDYLKNINIQLVANNVLNKLPAFQYEIAADIGAPAAFDPNYSNAGRLLQLTITKDW
jgi:hypothetical protein